ncbi:UNVERIFIED_CONTAM: hypothetical protein K2H54_063851 [Gekko kuhli]
MLLLESEGQEDFWFPNLIAYPWWKSQEIHLTMTEKTERDQQEDFWFLNLIPYPQWKKQEIHLSRTQKAERDQQVSA